MPSRFLFQNFIKRWAFFVAYVAFLYASLPWAPGIWGKIVSLMGESAKRLPFIFLILVFVFVGFSFLKLKKRRSVLGFLIICLVFITYWQMIRKLEFPAEKMHIVEYGLLSLVIYCSLEKGQSSRPVYLKIFLIGLAVGAIDEGIQYFLPNRVFDPKDVLLNIDSVFLGEVVIYCLKDLT